VVADFTDLSAHQVYACGAPIVVDSAQTDFVNLCQLPADEFYADSFITEADKANA
jgi:CDP-4-dehydro-6-deoxyglucose reductase, E3